MNKKILFLVLLSVLVFPGITHAVTLQILIVNGLNTALFIVSAVVIVLWLITGVMFLTAQGAPDKLIRARNALLAAVAGTVLVIVANSAIYLVGQAFGINLS